MKKVLLLVKDGLLRQKIRLALYGTAEVLTEEGEGAELLIRDGEGCVFVGDAVLPLPLSLAALWQAVEGAKGERILTLGADGRSAIFGGEIIRLTEVEYRLLAALMSARGEFVSRERLLREVWEDGASGGALNVYVHYLREKLERGGERLIVSSRTEGYRINGRYLK